jgi:hypothetical protein
MAEAKLQVELEQARQEVARLRERLTTGLPAVHKDLSLISLVPKWSGANAIVPLEEFLASVEGAAKIGNWNSNDCKLIAAMKLADTVKAFHNTCVELQAPEATWETFKRVFRDRFRDIPQDQFHFMRLQTARQTKGEGPQEFTDRCRALAQKIMCKDADPVAQRVHRENADRMILAAFVGGLQGNAAKQVRYQAPKSLDQALSIALNVTEAEKQEKFSETFYARFDEALTVDSRASSRAGNDRHSPRRKADVRSPRQSGTRRYDARSDPNKQVTSVGAKFAQSEVCICNKCNVEGHYARQCRTMSRPPRTHKHVRKREPKWAINTAPL